MTDIVERLRHCSENCRDEYLHELAGRAAAEIERLRAALREIAERHIPDQPSALDIPEEDYVRRQHTELRRIARAALEERT